MNDGEGGFLARWSRRKAGLPGAGNETAEPPARTPPGAVAPAPVAVTLPSPMPMPVTSTPPVPAPSAAAAPEPVALPTMTDVAALTRSSDYSRFVVAGVDPGVKNAAMKKLFSDPHFNVMDGLDTYIDDYGKPDPIPLSMLRLMNQSASLGLFDAEDDDTADAASAGLAALPDEASPDGAALAAVAQSNPPETLAALPAAPARHPDDDPDLRLQQDDAAREPGAGPGPRA